MDCPKRVFNEHHGRRSRHRQQVIYYSVRLCNKFQFYDFYLGHFLSVNTQLSPFVLMLAFTSILFLSHFTIHFWTNCHHRKSHSISGERHRPRKLKSLVPREKRECLHEPNATFEMMKEISFTLRAASGVLARCVRKGLRMCSGCLLSDFVGEQKSCRSVDVITKSSRLMESGG